MAKDKTLEGEAGAEVAASDSQVFDLAALLKRAITGAVAPAGPLPPLVYTHPHLDPATGHFRETLPERDSETAVNVRGRGRFLRHGKWVDYQGNPIVE